ncbi:MAG: hypothetical protein SFX73_28530 [Kofleriaceae bacterium]|nr:hypothetical protein [Kofleriaceae bacterium]
MTTGAVADSKRDKKKAPTPAPTPAPRPEPTATPAPTSEETPWGKGVSAESKATAQRLLGEGNDKFVVNQFREALEKYEAAVAAWDHPAIRFNMVRTLIALDRPLEAARSVDRVLAYGKEPFKDNESMYTEALNYQRLLASQIATLEVGCKQAGVDLKVDGQKFVECPGRSAKQMLPGAHALVAAKPGYKTETKDLVLLPGKVQPLTIELITLDKATLYKSRWATWKPWAVAGTGLVIVGLGGLVNLQASNDMDQVETQLEEQCGGGLGCATDVYERRIRPLEDRAILENRIGIGMMIAGGAVVTAGVVAVIMNRPKPYLKETAAPTGTTAQLVPLATRDGGGFAVTGSF